MFSSAPIHEIGYNLIAVLVANGSGTGIGKMADNSDENFNELISTEKRLTNENNH